MSFFIPYRPTFPLCEFIECLWFVKAPMPYKRERILPTGTIDLLINFGAPYKILHKTTFREIKRNQRFWITGLHTEHILSEAAGDETEILGVRFRPGGAYPFFGFPMSELHNQMVDADLIWQNFVDEVYEQLCEQSVLVNRFKLLESALLKKLKSEAVNLKTVRFAVQTLTRSDNMVSIKSLSEKIGYSQKHLIHLFQKTVGVGPKTLTRVYKFLTALNAIEPNEPTNWAEIAYRCNYYDQAHFTKDFTAFSGVSPNVYLKQRARFLGSPARDKSDVHFVPIG